MKTTGLPRNAHPLSREEWFRLANAVACETTSGEEARANEIAAEEIVLDALPVTQQVREEVEK